jgi:hypothetical protein
VVRFVRDNDAGPIPSAGEVTTVQDYIDTKRPAHATVTVIAPVDAPTAFTIAVVPNTTAVKEAVEAELEDLYSREAEPGATMLLSAIRTAIGNAPGLTDYTLTVAGRERHAHLEPAAERRHDHWSPEAMALSDGLQRYYPLDGSPVDVHGGIDGVISGPSPTYAAGHVSAQALYLAASSSNKFLAPAFGGGDFSCRFLAYCRRKPRRLLRGDRQHDQPRRGHVGLVLSRRRNDPQHTTRTRTAARAARRRWARRGSGATCS